MNRYLILLRGINVSGQKKIKMADLKELLTFNDYDNIKTHLQTGNILINTEKSKSDVELDIKQIIFKKYNFEVPVCVKQKNNINTVLKNFPFTDLDTENIGNKILISFLSKVPESDKVDNLKSYVKGPDMLEVIKDIVYLYCPNGYGKSKLTNNFLESKLRVISTTRNLNTLNKINIMD